MSAAERLPVLSGPVALEQAPTVAERNAEVIGRYLSAQRAVWRPGTLKLRRVQLHAFARALAPVPIVEASEQDLIGYYDSLAGRTPETLTSVISMLRGFYRWLQRRARPVVREDDPTLLLARPRIPRRLPRPMLRHDYQLALACAMTDPTLYAWLGLMGCCGLRCCEVAWLRQVDVEARPSGSGLLHVTGKGGHQRTVPVGSDLMIVLAAFLEPSRRGSVFRRPSDARAYSPDDVSRRVNRFLARIGVQATAHQLRHRFGTDYHAIDPDVFRQAEVMGHASVDMTRRYTALDPTEAALHVESLTRQQLGGTAASVGTHAPNPDRSGRRSGRSGRSGGVSR